MNSKTKAGKIIQIIVSALIWIVIAVAALFIIMTISSKDNLGMPTIFGLSFQSIQSPSMSGDKKDNFDEGDLIAVSIIDKSNPSKYNFKEGDIVVFRDFIDDSGVAQLIAHRITKIEERDGEKRYTTMGDNTKIEDKELKFFGDLEAYYRFKIKNVGSAADFIKSRNGLLVCVVIPLALFFLWRLIKLILVAKEYKLALADGVDTDDPDASSPDKKALADETAELKRQLDELKKQQQELLSKSQPNEDRKS